MPFEATGPKWNYHIINTFTLFHFVSITNPWSVHLCCLIFFEFFICIALLFVCLCVTQYFKELDASCVKCSDSFNRIYFDIGTYDIGNYLFKEYHEKRFRSGNWLFRGTFSGIIACDGYFEYFVYELLIMTANTKIKWNFIRVLQMYSQCPHSNTHFPSLPLFRWFYIRGRRMCWVFQDIWSSKGHLLQMIMSIWIWK